MDKDTKVELLDKISQVVTNAYRIGMVQGSGSEYFADGQIYTFEELNATIKVKNEELANFIEKL